LLAVLIIVLAEDGEDAAAPDSTLREETISPGNCLPAVVPNQAKRVR
jgi:hypothetical protein